MNELTLLSVAYALCQMTAGYCFSRKLRFALVIGTLGGCLGLTLGILVPEARGLIISCSCYIVMNTTGWRRWRGVPWFRHKKEAASEAQ